MNRSDFDSSRPVRLMQPCFTGSAMNVVQPGTYSISEVPDVAFELGIVIQEPLPPAPDPKAASVSTAKPVSKPETKTAE